MLSTVLQLLDKILTMVREWIAKKEVKQVKEERKKEIDKVKDSDEKLKEKITQPDPIDDLNDRFGWNPGVHNTDK